MGKNLSFNLLQGIEIATYVPC